jgi:ligand-binding SRPBCC domain-containing protein
MVSNMSKLYTKIYKQNLKTDINTIWDFISNPKNLQEITPKEMGFEILTNDSGSKMYAGMIIEYKVNVIKGFKIKWITEITHVSENNYFIDEQRFGPYRFWHHQHFVIESSNGIEMMDIISYKVPFGFLGGLVNYLFVNNKIDSIFKFRNTVLDKKFG